MADLKTLVDLMSEGGPAQTIQAGTEGFEKGVASLKEERKQRLQEELLKAGIISGPELNNAAAGKPLGNRPFSTNAINSISGYKNAQPEAQTNADPLAGLKEQLLKAKIGATNRANTGKPHGSPELTPTALKLQLEATDAIGTAEGIKADLSALANQIDSGQIKLGPIANKKSQLENYLGRSTPESRNYASFKATLEKIRNDSLRLNKGVQTEGDAVRAFNEIFDNPNDTQFVKQRLGEVARINERGAQLQKLKVKQIRQNSGLDALDTSGIESAAGKSPLGSPEAAAFIKDMESKGFKFKGAQ